VVKKEKIGLSLSGGGYRAAAYHLGTFKKLKEMGILDKINVMSTVSGGSIIGATYGLYGHDFDEFEKIMRKGVQSSVIKGVIFSFAFLRAVIVILVWLMAMIYFQFTDYPWISLLLFPSLWILIWFGQFHFLPLSDIIEKMYDKFFFQGKTLDDLNKNILFAINATNLETGRPFTFSNENMSDSEYTYMDNPNKAVDIFESKYFPIARAVAASASVPFAFTPVKITKPFFVNPEDAKRMKPVLVDGGVYDNQGAHKLTHEFSSYYCRTIIMSDAGNKMPFKNSYKNLFTVLLRTSNVFMNRIKNFQLMQNLYNNKKLGKREIAYQSLGWNLNNALEEFMYSLKTKQLLPELIEAHGVTQEAIKAKEWTSIEEKIKRNIGFDAIIAQGVTIQQLELARSVGTNLTALSNVQIEALMTHAATLTELQVKLYCPSLVKYH